MSTEQFMRSAALACEEGNAADEAGEAGDAVTYFRRALHLYRSALAYERNEGAKALLHEQCAHLRERIDALGVDAEKEVRPLRAKKKVAMDNNNDNTPQQGEDEGFHATMQALRRDAAQLGAVRWGDVVGLGAVKDKLLLATKHAQEMPQLFRGAAERPSAVLLYGPPGTGKTLVVRALAHESGRAFFAASTTDLLSKFVGDSAKLVRALCEEVRAAAPSILFLDELDGLCQDRDAHGQSGESTRATNELLTQLDGLGTDMRGVLLVGATNRPQALDGGVLRRFPTRFFLPLPDLEARWALLRAHLAGYAALALGPALGDDALWRLAEASAGYSGSDLAALVQAAYEASLAPLLSAQRYWATRDDAGERWFQAAPDDAERARPITYAELSAPEKLRLRPQALGEAELHAALQRVRPVSDAEQLRGYEEWTAKHGTRV